MARTGIVLFRRDLRLFDNTALLRAAEECDTVIPCFILDPRQLIRNPYRSENAVRFMAESLEDLERQLQSHGGRLYGFSGRADVILKHLLSDIHVDAVYANRDYTPFARMRDEQLSKVCAKASVVFILCDDALLHRPEDVLKADGKPYTVFTPYFNRASSVPVDAPQKLKNVSFRKAMIPRSASRPWVRLAKRGSENPAVRGGRTAGLKILKTLGKRKQYSKERDIPGIEGTTRLSAHLKFGTLSVREVYMAVCAQLSDSHPLIRQLYWRDFFTGIALHFPHVFGHAFDKRFEKLRWAGTATMLKKWKEGATGFPIVDAGMRELKQTGWMHNRVRMITASFLVKDLHCDWRKGEKHFAQLLIDYDPAVNNGNWQWAASTGCDAQPWFRIFNPWLQQQKLDPDCVYIKRWIPELKNVQPDIIHSWSTKRPARHAYPAPNVDHSAASQAAKHLYSQYAKN